MKHIPYSGILAGFTVVLNAFRHLRMKHFHPQGQLPSLPLVLNAFRHLRMKHTSFAGDAVDRSFVLNAFRHLRMKHPTCCTQHGLVQRSAQRLSASTDETPDDPNGPQLPQKGAQRLSASTDETQREVKPIPFCYRCAQRLSASTDETLPGCNFIAVIVLGATFSCTSQSTKLVSIRTGETNMLFTSKLVAKALRLSELAQNDFRFMDVTSGKRSVCFGNLRKARPFTTEFI